MAAIRALEWETEAFWISRIGAYLRKEHSPQLALSSRAAFTAADGTTVVGFVAGHGTRRFGCAGELQWINVTPERRGQGIAALLIAAMGEWFARNAPGRICVNVGPDNVAARNLYRRFGAVRLSDYWMVWEDGRRMRTSAP